MTSLRTKRVVLPVILAAFVSAGTLLALAEGDGSPAPFPPPEQVSRTGFAVWPEDSVAEAQSECPEHLDDQPWRGSARQTALAFAKQVMGHGKPTIYEDGTTVEGDEAEVWLGAPVVSLSNIVELRRFGSCWYIVRGLPREEGGGSIAVFARQDGRTNVYLESWKGRSEDYEEIGFGPHLKVFPHTDRPTRRVWRMPEDVDGEGHLTSIGWGGRGPEYLNAKTLPPPPDIGGGERVFPVDSDFSWRSIPKDVRRKSCRYSADSASTPRRVLNDVLQWEFGEALPSGPYPDVMRTGPHGSIGKRVRIDRWSKGNWKVTIDRVPYRFRVERATEDCWALDLIKPIHKKRPVEEAFVDDAWVTVDFRWGRAGKVNLSLGYGWSFSETMVHDNVRSRVAFFRVPEAEEVDVPSVGRLFITSFRAGRFVNAYARRLPPPADESLQGP